MKITGEYVLWVSIYTIVYATTTLIFGSLLEYIGSEYDKMSNQPGVQPSKIKLIIEIFIQLCLNAIGMYIIGVIVDKLLHQNFKLDINPQQYAHLVTSTVIFAQQPSLMKKIQSVFTFN